MGQLSIQDESSHERSACFLSLSPAQAFARESYFTVEQLASLSSSWQALARCQSSPIQQFAWVYTASQTLVPCGQLAIMALRHQGLWAALAPLRWRKLPVAGHLEMVGGRELCEPMDLLYKDQAALEALVEVLLGLRVPLLLSRLPANSPTVASFQRLAASRATVELRPHPGHPYLDLDSSWEEPESHMNSGRRSDFRRARRRAESHGPVHCEIITPQTDRLDALLDTAFQIEAHSWKGRTRTALLLDERRGRFFRSYAHAACREGSLRLAFLRLGDKPIGMQFAAVHNNSFWLLKIGYDEQYADCSPGILLLRDTLRYSVQAGLTRYEFLGYGAPWISAWTRQEHPCVSLAIYPHNVSGWIARNLDRGYEWLRKGFHR